ncbi:MAG: alpha amylase C-terminal domain-containing protein, partial [Pseudonocardia sp.]|nr:alpha amylase C-terminal domain-containing protein [Pseudonocardia sp.]
SENYVLPISHDEVVHGKGSLWTRMPGDDWNKAAGVRALLAYMWAHPGKQLLFMGSEFGQPREWSEQRSLDWHLLDDPLHGGVTSLVGDLNRVYRGHSALWSKDTTPDGFAWIDANDAAGNVLSFLRHGTDASGRATVLACVANFSGAPNENYRLGLPFAGRWTELLNTDAAGYGGSGVGNLGTVVAEAQMWHGQPASAALRLPPSGVLWLVPEETGGPVHPLGSGSGTVPAASVPPAVGAAAIPPVPEETDVPAPATPDDDVTASALPEHGRDVPDLEPGSPVLAVAAPEPESGSPALDPVAAPEPGDAVPEPEPLPGSDEALPIPGDDAATPTPTVTPSTSGAPGVRATRTGTFVTGTSGTGTSATGSSENGSSSAG